MDSSDVLELRRRLRRLRWLTNDVIKKVDTLAHPVPRTLRTVRLVGKALLLDPDFLTAVVGPDVRVLSASKAPSPKEGMEAVRVLLDSKLEADELVKRIYLDHPRPDLLKEGDPWKVTVHWTPQVKYRIPLSQRKAVKRQARLERSQARKAVAAEKNKNGSAQ
eukprot:TRINITY_DN16490_c0_g1_i1.p2 TRINITY_DN16490_c0_g1~~TRINITY_DN16490_c0_g1_i1.p2  ORF type:complete len:172 (+),score=34.89 TRINITY_DN16490_c0_g1_i1:30-518(+)